MTADNLIFAPVVCPLFGAALAFTGKAFFKSKASSVMEWIAVFSGFFLPLISLFIILPLIIKGEVFNITIGGWFENIGVVCCFDGLSWLMNLLSYTVLTASWFYSFGAGPKGHRFTAIFLIQTAALAAVSITSDLFNFFVCLEVLGVTSYVLITTSGKPESYFASFSYLMISASAMIFFLLGFYNLYRLTGSLSYKGIAQGLAALDNGGGLTAIFSIALIVSPVIMRTALMPFHGWLPDSHALAPHSVSAALSGIHIKIPLFAMGRILLAFPDGSNVGKLLSYAGAITAAAGVILALSQKDAKRLLAYHSISQIGYIIAAWGTALWAGLNTFLGVFLLAAAFTHAFFHALFKTLLFLTVGTTIDKAGNHNVYTLKNAGRYLKAKGEKLPFTMICFFIGAFAISAIPPFNGFGSKNLLTYGLKNSWHYYALIFAGIGTCASFIKLSKIYLPGGKDKKEFYQLSDSSENNFSTANWPIIHGVELFLGLACIVSGIFITWFFKFILILLNNSIVQIQGYSPDIPEIYSYSNIIKSMITLLFGFLLFILINNKTGKKVLSLIHFQSETFFNLFFYFIIGTIGIALWLIYF